ncbi:MAG TPA: branched-chain amino acid ABC transporter substrate-binding protein [Thermomicrobiales bacterium]|nr:branched-chain amino acid ABC transporter substrate-binding protein [Thermomicrobiales bacterium]
MAREWIGDLTAKLHAGTISRREFAQRAAALGFSATLIGQALRATSVAAQDSTPAAGGSAMGGGPGEIGMEGIEHITDTSKGKVKFYSSWPLIAATAQTGGDMRAAVELAVEDFGKAAGGFALEFEALDDALASTGNWDAGKESENANKAANDADAMVYIGTYNSGAANISIPILNEVPMAMISPGNTYPGLTQAVEGVTAEGEPEKFYPSGKRNYMRNTVADHLQAGAQINWALNTMGFKKAYILHDDELYGKGLAIAFQLYFKKFGGEVLGFEKFQRDAPDYQALATSIADKAPDIIFISTVAANNPAKVTKDLRSVLTPDQTAILGPDGLFNQAYIDAAGDEGEGVYITFGGVPPEYMKSDVGKAWTERMQKVVGHSPDAYSTYAYEAAVIAIQAIDKVQEKDRQKILDAMFATKDFHGLSGTYSFTETGDPDKPSIFLGQVKDGKITEVAFITPPENLTS